MTGNEVVDDFKIAAQFLPIGGRCGGVPRRGGSGKTVGFGARGDSPLFIQVWFYLEGISIKNYT
jgi:hypothetical protein